MNTLLFFISAQRLDSLAMEHWIISNEIKKSNIRYQPNIAQTVGILRSSFPCGYPQLSVSNEVCYSLTS